MLCVNALGDAHRVAAEKRARTHTFRHLYGYPNVREGQRISFEAVVAGNDDDHVYLWIGGHQVKLSNFDFNVAKKGD